MCRVYFNVISNLRLSLSLCFFIVILFSSFADFTSTRSIKGFAFFDDAYALPMDWQGTFAADTCTIGNFRRTTSPYQANPDDGSQQIPASAGGYANSSYQSYILKLAPSIVINDGASFYAEMTTGYNRGGFFGDSSAYKKDSSGASTFGDALYLQNTYNGNSNLALSQFNVRLYSDTATYIIGRQSFHWGIGAVMNSGDKTWDRYATIQDGITAKFKIGNFNFTPYYALINSTSELTKIDDTKTFGISMLYDSVERDMSFGILFGKRYSSAYNSFYQSSQGYNLGSTAVTIIDLYLRKTLNKFSFSIEAPIISGNVGNVYDYSRNNGYDYKAYAVVLESSFKLNENWNIGAMLGYVSGEDGEGPEYGAMYLNPNYKIANILFNHNMAAVVDANQSIYDSYIVNTRYLKLHGSYAIGLWTYNAAYITARANETAAGGGKNAFNHTRNKRFVSRFAQDNNLGNEIDFGINYQWNSSVSLNTALGYLFVGDYYRYTNPTGTDSPLDAKNSYSFVFGIATTF